jgi:hypothetical protein
MSDSYITANFFPATYYETGAFPFSNNTFEHLVPLIWLPVSIVKSDFYELTSYYAALSNAYAGIGCFGEQDKICVTSNNGYFTLSVSQYKRILTGYIVKYNSDRTIPAGTVINGVAVTYLGLCVGYAPAFYYPVYFVINKPTNVLTLVSTVSNNRALGFKAV